MGLRRDVDRYRDVGEERRQDLREFVQYGDLGDSLEDRIRIPIKVVDLPEFSYDEAAMGGIGKGDADVGQPVGEPAEGDAEGDEPGEEGGEHGYYEMDPEEFAEELDREFELDLEPKGKSVVEEKEGDLTDLVRSGPSSTLDFRRMFKRGLKRKIATEFDEDYLREALKVEGAGPQTVYEWARSQSINVSLHWLEAAYDEIPRGERGRYASFEDFMEDVERTTVAEAVRGMDHVPLRKEDERYRYPQVVEEKESKVVVVNIRDVSGSMGRRKRDLVERTFTPLDWYLTGKYEEAEFVYVAHDVDAWRVEREEFFGIQSGGGTRISSAYELVHDVLEEEYPYSDWNRYVFAAGDGENSSNDSSDNVVPLMKEMDVNLHAYVETQPSGGGVSSTHSQELEKAFGDSGDVAVVSVNSRDEVMDAVEEILRAASRSSDNREQEAAV